MNKNLKILLALGAVALVVGLTVGLSSNRQPSEDKTGSIRGIQDTYTNGIIQGDPGTVDNWARLTLDTGVQTDSTFLDVNKESYLDRVLLVVRHDPLSATTSNESVVEAISRYRLDVGTSTTANFATGLGLSQYGGGFYATGTPGTLPYGSIVDGLLLTATTGGTGLTRSLSFDRDQLYRETMGSTTLGGDLSSGIYQFVDITAGGARFLGDDSEMLPLPITVATSTRVTALLYEQGGQYDVSQRHCTPGADDPGYGCQTATSTARGFIVDVWLHYVTR